MANLLIIFGSTGGNTQSISERIANLLTAAGHTAEVKNVVDSQISDMDSYDTVLLGSSTWNDGDLQDDFVSFHLDLEQSKPDLSAKKFAIFGCGESIYEKFCGAVDILENIMTELKATKLVESLKIDGYPEEEDNVAKIETWVKELTTKLA